MQDLNFRILASGLFFQLLLPGQTKPAATQSFDPEFEVASIRAAQPLTLAMIQAGQVHSQLDDAVVVFSNVPLMTLITIAYSTKPELVSGPSWLDNQFFAVAAKLPVGASKEQTPVMLRRLLADRFKLEVHHSQKVEPVYLMTVGKQGAKLKAPAGDTEPDGFGCQGGLGHYRCRSASMAGLADFLRTLAKMAALAPARPTGNALEDTPRNIDLPVVDQTGLTGVYDFELEWSTPTGGGRGGGIAPPNPSTKATSIWQALEAVGLTLKAGKFPYDVLVIDHVNKVPSEN